MLFDQKPKVFDFPLNDDFVSACFSVTSLVIVPVTVEIWVSSFY
jgi:hypothetical protein